MLSGLGPVMRYELITTARRSRYYVFRFVYGLGLFVMLSLYYLEWETNYPEGATPEIVRQFAENTFIKFGMVQGWMVLCLVPGLISGVIADEHQRKTLHYLLASQLSSAEIVLGKLFARLLHLGVYVAVGIPIVCLLGLYGGLNPDNVALVYGGTLTTALLLAGLAMLISTLARNPREALMAAYGLEFLWLVVPPLLAPWTRYLPWYYEWVGPVNDVLLATNPLVIWERVTNSWSRSAWMGPAWTGSTWSGWLDSFPMMVGLQAAFGLAFLLVAIVGLRPFRGNSWPGSQPRLGVFRRLVGSLRSGARARAAAPLVRNRLLVPPRPPCHDRPMLWKERYTPLAGGLTWLGSRLMALVLFTFLGCVLLEPTWTLLKDRFSPSWKGLESRRTAMASDLRATTVLASYLGITIVAAAAAVSLTAEREHDTWTSLATTLVSPGEVVFAKQFGALWSARWVGLLFLVLWGLGLVLEAFHPLAVFEAVLLTGMAAWAIAAIGVLISTEAENSTRSQMLTLLVVFSLFAPWLPRILGWVLWTAKDEEFLLGGLFDMGALAGSWQFWLLGILGLAVWIRFMSGWTIRKLGKAWGG